MPTHTFRHLYEVEEIDISADSPGEARKLLERQIGERHCNYYLKQAPMKEDNNIPEKGIEELLKPRYKVIADMPFNHFKVGQIVDHINTIEGYRFDKYPHLFRKLEWWEERTPDEMPKYVKWKKDKKVYKVGSDGYVISSYQAVVHPDYTENRRLPFFHLSDTLPATEAEYSQQKQST